MKTCPDCNGDGVIEKGTDDEQQCPTCGGCGFLPDDDDGQEEVINTRQPNGATKPSAAPASFSRAA
jgi:DnaJ-class molecular chaperone